MMLQQGTPGHFGLACWPQVRQEPTLDHADVCILSPEDGVRSTCLHLYVSTVQHVLGMCVPARIVWSRASRADASIYRTAAEGPGQQQQY